MATISSYLRTSCFIAFATAMLLVALSSCTRHYAAATTAAPVEKNSAPVAAVPPAHTDTVAGPTLRDSLIGTWHLRTVELEDAVNTLSSYGSQTERDQMMQKQKQFQDALRGLTATFSADSTYTSAYSGQKDSGTWRVTRRRGLDTISKTDGSPSSYRVRSVTPSTLVVLLDASDVKLLLTLDRQ